MKTLAYIICYLIYPFSFLIPRNKRCLAFGSYRGSFSDNSKYLFIYAAEHCRDLDICWLSVNRQTVKLLRSLGLPAYWVLSPIGTWKALRAKYWFVSAYTSDIMYCLSGNAVVINLWHGIGLKKCEFNIQSGGLADRYVKQTFKERFYHPESFRRPNYLLSSTQFQTIMFASAFRIPQERCLELGYPRNQILTWKKEKIRTFVEKYEPKETLELIHKMEKFDKVFIYMPTWRDSQLNIFTQQFDLEALNKVLVEQNALMLLKPHPNTQTNDVTGYPNILLVNRTTDVYGVLPFTDVLITDYSSILYDYLLMSKKEVILFLYDYDEYVRDRDFYYPFEENVVGKKVVSFVELLQCIKSGEYRSSQEQKQLIIEKFWGKTTKLNASEEIMKKLC